MVTYMRPDERPALERAAKASGLQVGPWARRVLLAAVGASELEGG